MDQTTRKSLTQSLSKLTVEIAAALRVPMRTPGPVQEAAQALHREEQVGEAFDLWTDLLSRRASVLWVLKSLYLRILEDRGLLQPRRILDAEDELFRHLAPNLGPTAYLRWVFRDLASARGGLPELFAPQPAELAVVPDALSQRLIDFWRSKNPDTGELLYRFDDEHFDSRLMGDLYQDLDPVVKKRYALLQTPDFVLDFILDETLTPAIAEWGVENVRVLDPACGSGHFLLAAFKRIVAGMRSKHPARPVREIVEDVLSRVVGIDLNDYACGLARARLVMTALETCRETDLAAAGTFHPRVFWADALEQVEEDEQLGLAEIADDHRPAMALLTPPEVRAALRPELKKRFHVVVGNPPYITEKDARKRDYHKEKKGKRRRYLSASGKYSLGAPFTERMMSLANEGGWMGAITADSFMKRKFGKPLIEQVLAKKDLTKVVATAGAHIPGHTTPTVILFVRNRPPQGDSLRVVMGKRGEPGRPVDAASGRVWSSIRAAHQTAGFENEFISVADLSRVTMNTHEWSIGGSEALAVLESLRESAATVLGTLVASTGFASFSGEDDAFIQPRGVFARAGIDALLIRPLIKGEDLRNWTATPDEEAFCPYDLAEHERLSSEPSSTRAHLWRLRTLLRETKSFGEKTKTEDGKQWWEWYRWIGARYRPPAPIAYAYKATHNHFVRGAMGQVFRGGTSCGTIKLPPGAPEALQLVLVAQLNSSVGDFWTKQVCQNPGAADGRKASAAWEHRYERDGSKLEAFPIASTDDPRLVGFAARIDSTAKERASDAVDRVLASSAGLGAAALRVGLNARRERDMARLCLMAGLQEELDWVCYELYGLDPATDVRPVDEIAPIQPGLRPFELTLAQEDAERTEAQSRGEEPDEAPTRWFSKHGWSAQLAPSKLPPAERMLVEARIERTLASPQLTLLEQPTFKRPWYHPDYDEEERNAMLLWLDERLERWCGQRSEPFTAAQASAALRSDPDILSVGELLTGRSDFDVDTLLAQCLRLAAVPNLKHHRYTSEGLLRRARWEQTWDEQHREDGGEQRRSRPPERYNDKDYLRKEYWAQRGKLDVPKERFIAFTEVPPPTGAETLYGWAGWTPRQRAKAMLGLDEQLESAGVKVVDRHGLLYGVWFLLPYVAWESADAARDFRADVRSLVGENGVTEAMLDEWAKRFPAPKGGKPAKPKAPPSEAPKAKKGARAKAKAKEDTAT